MTIVVLNASGVQAKAIADRLEQEGPVRRLARSPGPGLTTVDTTSRAALTAAFAGADAVVFTSPADYRPGVRRVYAETVVAAADDAAVGRLVLNTAAPILEGSPGMLGLREVRDIVRDARTPATIVQPTIYLDNLLAPWSLPALLNDGVLAYALGAEAKVSWISHRSLADFVAAAIRSETAAGQTFDIGGSRALTGTELADIVGAASGRPVRYLPLEPEAFAAGLAAQFGPEAAQEIGAVYARAAQAPDSLIRSEEPWRRCGVEPETPESWASRQVWQLS